MLAGYITCQSRMFFWDPHTLLASAIFGLAMFCNTAMYRKLPNMAGFAVFVHLLGFFAIVIVLW